jgi:hypothetical protein
MGDKQLDTMGKEHKDKLSNNTTFEAHNSIGEPIANCYNG